MVNYDKRLRGSMYSVQRDDHCLLDSGYFLLPLFHDYHLLSSIVRVSAQSCISWVLCFGMQEVFHDSWRGCSDENPPLILRSLTNPHLSLLGCDLISPGILLFCYLFIFPFSSSVASLLRIKFQWSLMQDSISSFPHASLTA